jgi:NADH-quinone oxidoreductase subunit E
MVTTTSDVAVGDRVAHVLAGRRDLSREHLIPLLQEVQAELGHLPPEAMEAVAAALGVTTSRVYGVATFYNQFRFAPMGRHVIEVCRGTACHVKESKAVLQHVTRRLKIRADGNSPDDRFTVVSVACLGACSIAPVIRLDGEFHGHLTIETLDTLLDELDRRDEEAA